MPLPFIKNKPKIPPIERVRDLTSKGFSEIEIIDILKKEGYSPGEIDIAFSQLLKESIEKETKKEEQKTSLQPIYNNPTENIQQQTEAQTYPYSYSIEDYINYIDYLIQNRVSEIGNQIKSIENKYIELEKRFNETINQFREEKTKYLETNREIFESIAKIEKEIKELLSKIGALEEILKDIIPLLIDSVRTLSHIAKK
ncbi:MAG: hypothetical protein QXY70_02625 [Nanopusillaceae archaeon]